MLKKCAALLLAISMLLIPVIAVFPASAAVDGDVNGDGNITVTDYLLVKRHVLGTKTLTSSQKNAADIDKDGDVDSIDYIMLKRMVLGTLSSKISTAKTDGISYSKSYTKGLAASGTYPDSDNMELTDGYIPAAADIQDPGYSGYYGSDLTVTINLGSAGKDICGFDIYYLVYIPAGVYAPAAVTVSGSNSANGSYTQIAHRTIPSNSDDGVKKYTIKLSDTCDYSYIKFVFKKNIGWFFISEVVVNGIVDGVAESVSNPYDSQFTETVATSNLNSVLSGSAYNASKGSSVISKNCGTSISHTNYDTRCGYVASRLTDAAITGSHSASGRWNGVNTTNVNTSITLTLNNYNSVNDVCGFAVHMFNRPSATINLPSYVDIEVSKNGTNFYKVGRVYAPDTKQENFVYSLHLTKLLSAKKVRFTFPATNGYMWIEEIEVYANRSTSVSSVATTGYLKPSSSVLGGVEDLALIYFNHGTNYGVNQEMLLPYVGYLDEDGNVIDTMFDGYLFLPQVGRMSCENHTPYGINCAKDWNWYFNEMFKSNYNLDALNKTAEKVKLLLGKSELKLKVFLTLPHMDYTVTNFGDINNDGVNEDVTTKDGRVDTAKKFTKRLQDTFNSKNYANLELCGFYWFHEEIADYDWNNNYTGDAQTAKAVTAAVKTQTGLPMFWIPYYQARGYNSGYSFGFQAVCYQPNYAFDLNVDVTRLGDAAAVARQYGMCIELEMGDGADVDYRYFQKYMDYLSGGVTYGYMNNSIHMYYQNRDTIGRTWNDEGRSRLIYTYTYDFIKGKLDTTPDAATGISITVHKNTPYRSSVNTNEDDRQIYKLSTSPAHGSIAFAEDGTFVYYPNKNFTGTDTFKYKISNYLGWSTECTVTITVK